MGGNVQKRHIITSSFFLLIIALVGGSIYLWNDGTMLPHKKCTLGFTSTSPRASIAQLEIQGTLPSWLQGELLLMGPGIFEYNNISVQHWLDGFACLYRFAIAPSGVSYDHAVLSTKYYTTALEHNYAPSITNTTLVLSWWQRLKQMLRSSPKATHTTHYDNACMNVIPRNNQYIALSDFSMPVVINKETFSIDEQETNKQDKKDNVSAAQVVLDPLTDIYYRLEVSNQDKKYIIHAHKKNDRKEKTIATIATHKPSYMHSLSITEQYIIIIETPLRYTQKSFTTLLPQLKNYFWKQHKKTQFIIIDKKTGIEVSRIATPAFFSFHQVNAREEANTIVLDVVTTNAEHFFANLNFAKIRSNEPLLPTTSILRRYTLDLTTNTATSHVLVERAIELPAINKHYRTKHYTTIYALSMSPRAGMYNQIVKIDLSTHKSVTWQAKGCYPSQPVFVAAPCAQAEDDGVLLSVILDTKTKQSFLLVLDAATFNEHARILLPHHIPFTVHANFYES